MQTKQRKSSNYDYFIRTDTSSFKGQWIAIFDAFDVTFKQKERLILFDER